jgi:hypothetical protein
MHIGRGAAVSGDALSTSRQALRGCGHVGTVDGTGFVEFSEASYIWAR